MVHDISGVGDPLHLVMDDITKTTWIPGGLSIDASTIVESVFPATKLFDALTDTKEITLEAWVTPDNTTQGGPARIVTMSEDTSDGNFTLGQDEDIYMARLRTSSHGGTGKQHDAPADTATESLTHVVYTRTHPTGVTKFYIDGVLQSPTDTAVGTFSNWDDDFKFALANEFTLNRTWLGDMYLVAVYDRPLSDSEVEQNYDAGANPPIASPLPDRVSDHIVVRYNLDEGVDDDVFDTSGVGSPLNLKIDQLSNITWVSDGLIIDSGAIVKSASAADKIFDAITATDEITIEAWVKPANTSQGGPARIVTMSKDTGDRNFTMGQAGDEYDVRLRTTSTSDNGTPSLSTSSDSVTTSLTHVVFTRNVDPGAVGGAGEGVTKIYINGVLVATGTAVSSIANSWDDEYKFALANELTEDRDWLGELYLVAIYDSELSSSEVVQNYHAGHR